MDFDSLAILALSLLTLAGLFAFMTGYLNIADRIAGKSDTGKFIVLCIVGPLALAGFFAALLKLLG